MTWRPTANASFSAKLASGSEATYPLQSNPAFKHLLQIGLVSSHLMCRILDYASVRPQNCGLIIAAPHGYEASRLGLTYKSHLLASTTSCLGLLVKSPRALLGLILRSV